MIQAFDCACSSSLWVALHFAWWWIKRERVQKKWWGGGGGGGGVEVYNVSYTRKFSLYKMKVTKWWSVSCERIPVASESWWAAARESWRAATGEFQPVGVGEFQPVSCGELQPVGPGELQPVGPGELQPVGLGELQPVGPGELQPVGLGELQPVGPGELQPVGLGELQPLGLGELHRVSLGELKPVSLVELQPLGLGELQPVSLGQVQTISLGELQPVSLGELQPVSLGELQPVSLLLHLVCLQWCKNAGPGSCQFFHLKQSFVLLAFHKAHFSGCCVCSISLHLKKMLLNGRSTQVPLHVATSVPNTYTLHVCLFVFVRECICFRNSNTCVWAGQTSERELFKEREAKHKYARVLRYTTVFLSEPPFTHFSPPPPPYFLPHSHCLSL